MALKRNRVQTLGVADLDVLRENIERIGTAGYRVVSQIDDAIARIEDEVEKLDATTKGQQNDIDHKKADLNSLRREKEIPQN
ncbi:hypothetical protein CH063_05483 [Colletotrichum higginsianum]|uniref:Uncharacterized protein n=1 Tax=Colletotrichum higginsianum (strain IMI 349063) TaxID=759273 RepID=H1UZ63_COLHI|nr:hypothetical protein CH063_05483 [Colletotrichum higginsianum]